MSSKKNRKVVQRYFELVWGEKEPDHIPEFWAEDFVYHGGPDNVEQLQAGAAAYFNAFPDAHWPEQEFIAKDDKVIVRWTLAGTHEGEFMGTPATGNKVSYSGISIFRLEHGRIAEVWVAADNLSMMRQIGAVPSP